MAITHRDTQNAVGSTTAVVTKPTGCVDNDLLVAEVSSSGGTVSAPAGWSTIRTTNFTGASWLGTFYKIAAGEGATFAFNGTTGTRAVVGCFTGTATSSVLDVESGASNAADVSCCAPSVTTSQANDLLIFGGANANSATTFTPPTGMTEPTNGETTRTELAYLLDAGGAGATGDKTATQSASQANGGHLAAFKILVTSTIVSPPVATATSAGVVPTPAVNSLPAQATATSAAPTPTPTVKVLPGVATATGAALAPGIGPLTIPVPVATATGAAATPIVKVVVLPGLATATGGAFSPATAVSIPPPQATATGVALGPTMTVRIVVDVAVATGRAAVPTAVTAILVPVATATATAPTVTVSSLLAPGVATAVAEALTPIVLAYQRVALLGLLGFAPAVALDATLGSAVSFDLALSPPVAEIALLEPF